LVLKSATEQAAVEAELVVVGGAALGVLEAVRQQQQAALEIHGLELLAPELVGDADHREAEVLLGQAHAVQEVLGHLPEDRPRQQFGAVERLAEAGNLGADAVAQRPRLGDDLEVGGVGLFFLLLVPNLYSARHGRLPRAGVQSRRAGHVLRAGGGERPH
jgi:hypothetical protein